MFNMHGVWVSYLGEFTRADVLTHLTYMCSMLEFQVFF